MGAQHNCRSGRSIHVLACRVQHDTQVVLAHLVAQAARSAVDHDRDLIGGKARTLARPLRRRFSRRTGFQRNDCRIRAFRAVHAHARTPGLERASGSAPGRHPPFFDVLEVPGCAPGRASRPTRPRARARAATPRASVADPARPRPTPVGTLRYICATISRSRGATSARLRPEPRSRTPQLMS